MQKNYLLKLIFLLICYLSGFYNFATAQINVVHIDDTQTLSGKHGVFYALPRTLIKFEITVEKLRNINGPYAEFAGRYLGIDNVITYDYFEYKIKDIQISIFSEPDPEQYYFVELGEKTAKEDKLFFLSLTESGLIQNVNGISENQTLNKLISHNIEKSDFNADIFKYFADANLYEKTDTIVRIVNVDTVIIKKNFYKKQWVEKPTEQKAIEAADYITKIRDSRFNLISGYQEVNYDAGSIKYMDTQLKNLENEYMSLFTGVTISKTLKYSFVYLPDPDEDESLIPVFRFSEKKGISDISGTEGDKVFINIEKTGNTNTLIKHINKLQDSEKNTHGFYYRIPEYANISLNYSNDIKIKGKYLISQFGVITFLPVQKSIIKFYPNTGAIKNIVIE
ncbi:MAG: DUF4831 family protein [Bacteroidales bacterium]|nr:DUF4831 family protein [Bacteroidales bacterium]